MADLRTRLTRSALVLAKIETVIGTDAAPSALLDAIEVEEPTFQIDPQVLERNYSAPDLSPFANLIGRKQATMTFTTEIKGNGKQQSGLLADAPVLAKLIQASGYELLAMNTPAAQIGDVIVDFNNAKANAKVAFTKGGTILATKPVLYTITVTASGLCEVASNDLLVDDTSADDPADFVSGTPIPLGGSGATVTPAWTGGASAVAVGSIFRVLVMPVGLKLKPISKNQKTLTLHMFLDGVLHKMTASLGNFEITAEAGTIAKANFTFQGNYIKPEDEEAPEDAVFPDILPAQVELSNLTWGSNRDLVAQQWTFNQANTLTPRPDVNSKEGVKSYRITARAPEGGFNPEATTEADHPFWEEIETGKTQAFFAKIGQDIGNTVAIFLPKAQLSALPYGDRDGIRTYDTSFRATRNNGDDESGFYLI